MLAAMAKDEKMKRYAADGASSGDATKYRKCGAKAKLLLSAEQQIGIP